MGLDNLPHTYACRNEGTAISRHDDDLDRDFIDCEATMAADGCPWQRESAGQGAPVYGMLGAPCWYRGKSGSWMLDELRGAGHTLPAAVAEGFYGDVPQEDEGPHLSPEYCTELAAWMADHAEAYAALQEPAERAEAVEHYRYAAWWLRFTAEHCGGSDVWF